MGQVVSEPVWIALIQWVFGPVSLAVIGILGAKFSKRLKSVEHKTDVVKNEVKNSHTTNLRNDLDDKFDLVFAKLDAQSSDIRSIGNTLTQHTRDISSLFRGQAGLREDFENHRE